MKGTIKSKETISWLFNHGKKYSGRGFIALYSQNTQKSPDNKSSEGRIAVVAGKRLGSAPARNRAKRRLRETARAAGAPWSGYDVVFVARKDTTYLDYEVLYSHMQRLRDILQQPKAVFQGNDNAEPDDTARQNKQVMQERCSEHCSSTSFFANKKTKDAEKQNTKQPFIIGIPQSIALLCISVYRHAISPLFPPSCRFVPTCSEYALISFQRFGFCKGLWLTVTRIGRCHPFSKGGYDPVPEKDITKLA